MVSFVILSRKYYLNVKNIMLLQVNYYSFKYFMSIFWMQSGNACEFHLLKTFGDSILILYYQ